MSNHINTKYQSNYIGKLLIKPNEEYLWLYNDYFKDNKFIKPYDSLDWIVIGQTKFSHSSFNYYLKKYSYKLSEGDLIKLGKITFLVRKIKIKSEQNLTSRSIPRDNSNFNSFMNINNSINEEFANYNNCLNNNNDLNYMNTNNELLNSFKTSNIGDNMNKNSHNNKTNKVNDKLKVLYLKLKTINEKQKTQHFKCRLCFCEGNFEGNDPLISPCKCVGSVTYIHLNCLRKWLTSKVITKSSQSGDIYCYLFKKLECEICKAVIPEIVEYRGKFISLLDFKEVDPPYIVLQTMYQYNSQNRNISDFNAIFLISFKIKPSIMIGRANYSDIRLSDVSVSRNHSIISYFEEKFYIDDLGSKFGTLLLIQNNIAFLPYKIISIQTGKCHLMFRLTRTCLGWFKCYNNSLYYQMNYESYFKTRRKKVYFQILDDFNNNIIDPIEKFNTIEGSVDSIDNKNDDEEKDIEIKTENQEEKKNEDDEKTEKRNTIMNNDINENIDLRYMFENSIASNGVNNEFNNKIINNFRRRDKKSTINKKKGDKEKENQSGSFFMKKINNSFITEKKNHKENESNDILFQHSFNYIPKIKTTKNINFSILNIFNILKRKKTDKKPLVSPNKNGNENGNGKIFNSLINKKNNNILILGNNQNVKNKINHSFD